MKLKCEKKDGTFIEDPIHGTIKIPFPFSKIILTKEMQRLKNISQNGFAHYKFKELKNNERFSHSIGAYHVMTLIIEKLEKILNKYNIQLEKDDKDIALTSMLLHDIGHGPFSHSFEKRTNYSHEKRTKDIILGNTEINKLLTELFGKKKVLKIASFISETNDQETDSFKKLFKSLVSHQLDADRLDYLMRDSYYASLPSSINLHKIIENLSVIVNKNQEYELVLLKEGLASIENILIQRFQMYRDIYLNPYSVLMDEIFKQLLEKYQKNKKLHSEAVTKNFNIFANDPENLKLEVFLKMSDEDIEKSLKVLSQNKIDPVVAYLSNPLNYKDYILIENSESFLKIKKQIQEIFKDNLLKDTISIVQVKIESNLYKKEESLKIQFGNQISDLTNWSNLIRDKEMFTKTYLFFSPNLLRFELNLSVAEFNKYMPQIKKMITKINKTNEEFELKYIIEPNIKNILPKLINVFKENGFKQISLINKQNDDQYFDTQNLSLYKKGGSLRIRKLVQNGTFKYIGTYKMPIGIGEVYSSRTEIEQILSEPNLKYFKDLNKDISKIIKDPLINCQTKRIDVEFEKNEIKVCLSLDKSIYLNNSNFNKKYVDNMLEIEVMGSPNDRIILNEIHRFIIKSFNFLTINKQSKYERAVDRVLK